MSKTTKKRDNKKKESLVSLVANSDKDPAMITLELSRAGLLKQYENELKKKIEVKPSLTVEEFNKIMNGE